VWANHQAADFTGWEASEMHGQVAHSLLHHHKEGGAAYPESDCPLSKALRLGEAANVDNEVLWSKAGVAKMVHYVASPLLDEGVVVGQVVSCIDISRRQAVERAGHVAEITSKIAVACVGAENLEVALRTTMEQVMQGFGFEVAHALVETQETGKTNVWRHFSEVGDEYRQASTAASEGKGDLEHVSRRALALQRLVTVSRASSGKLLATAAVPLLAEGRLAGVMEFGGRGGEDIDADLLEVLNGAATQVSWAIERMQGRWRLRAQEALLASEIRSLEQAKRENALLGELGSLLDSCRDQGEMQAVVGDFGAQLFPGYSGDLALGDAQKGTMAVKATWGEEVSKPHFAANDCWGLRRGRLHGVEAGGKLYCEHLLKRGGKSVCVPLYNHGEVLGVLNLYAKAGAEDADQLALRVSESLAVAMGAMQVQEMLREQKNYDSLTGLGNRRALERALGREMERARHAPPLALALLVLDIEHFEDFNKTMGKEIGDIALKALATSLSYQIRGRDLVCRTGGNEFAIMFPDTAKAVVEARATQIREKVARLRIGEMEEVRGLSLGMGLSVYQEGEGAEEMLERARAALVASREAQI
jgi:diguanylate cyclase (GGDEF)-like protein